MLFCTYMAKFVVMDFDGSYNHRNSVVINPEENTYEK